WPFAWHPKPLPSRLSARHCTPPVTLPRSQLQTRTNSSCGTSSDPLSIAHITGRDVNRCFLASSSPELYSKLLASEKIPSTGNPAAHSRQIFLINLAFRKALPRSILFFRETQALPTRHFRPPYFHCRPSSKVRFCCPAGPPNSARSPPRRSFSE